ncbi:MAG: phosphoadenosine phosphosulfate reductase [Lokiarchaeia virus VerdaV1]|uniref:Phosphoadenosine phosphosulfate reductase n=1 Tax=Lokiarchaeia virus VerdaV1 TaxID=3070170 RepID=A0AA35G9R5_9CAUD|nr:MAG: phosphoadenosine phosphosulfate reductase [Lokiarchaeia virus VerdaV1]BDI54890.1 MAG: phosphoadenosine phosphosulfate reductase [Lokiarchaeia virus VerdaV1]
MNVLSYSGGADSTAALLYCTLNDIPYREIIYVEDWFPYPGNEMNQYFEYIENEFNFRITTLPCDRALWLNKNKGIHPRLPYPYCCRIKSQIFAYYLKKKYGRQGITIIMGIRKKESGKRKKYLEKGKWFWNKRFSVNYDYYYPVFKFIDSKHYCNIHGIKINPLYDTYGLRRLGCFKCYKTGDFRWKPKDEQQTYLTKYLEVDP